MLKTINKLTKERLAKGGPGSGRYPKGSSEQKEPASAKSGHHVEMDGKINSTGTSLKGYLPDGTKYADVVRVFGSPNAKGDDYKTDAEWRGQINGNPFTIYNYKTGNNYLGDKGKDVSDITDWHIGAHRSYVADQVNEHFNRNSQEKP